MPLVRVYDKLWVQLQLWLCHTAHIVYYLSEALYVGLLTFLKKTKYLGVFWGYLVLQFVELHVELLAQLLGARNVVQSLFFLLDFLEDGYCFLRSELLKIYKIHKNPENQ